MAENVFPGRELARALEAHEVPAPGLMLTGMVRATGQSDSIEFTNAGCNSWMTVPVDMVDQAEHLGYGTCRDHSHPVFRLTLKDLEDPMARVLASLLRNAQQQVANSEMSHMAAGMRTAESAYSEGASGFPATTGGGQAMRISVGGAGGLGGTVLGAWGCWDSTCTECILSERVCNGTACWTICKIWIEKPCERCIWPW
jgi:hypothetical protein